MLRKIYGQPYGLPAPERRYSPPECISVRTMAVCGNPNPAHVSTSYVERQNLTMRMSIRRFTRLTNAFSKKIENHACAVALFFTYYNFARVHQTIKTTPAVAAGVADHVWEIGEIVDLLETEPAHWQTAKQSA